MDIRQPQKTPKNHNGRDDLAPPVTKKKSLSFPGAGRILRELADGAPRARVGLRPEGRAPMREGTELFDAESGGAAVGRVTSGGFGPSVSAPVAMGYVPSALSRPGTRLWGELRGRRLPVEVVALPFVAPGFKR